MKFFKIFTTCKFVRGANRSIICDLQRQSAKYIPNDLMDIVDKIMENNSIENILNDYGKDNEKTIKEYFDFLDEKEYGFYCEKEELKRFPNMDLTFSIPSHITNIVIELKRNEISNLKKLVYQIEKLGCKNLSLVFYESLNAESIKNIFRYFKDTRIISIEITCRYFSKIDEEYIESNSLHNNRLTSLLQFNSPINKTERKDDKILFERIYTSKSITSFNNCGTINRNTFSTNQDKFLESINYNSCLYKKISIDIEGNIKNCPSMPQSFGNIKDTTLEVALNHKDFKKYWNITKDKIEVCKDCEFRHICTDCRAYIENPDDIYSKPLKCGYDPYTNKWEEWSTNPLKQKAIEFYGMQDLVKKDA